MTTHAGHPHRAGSFFGPDDRAWHGERPWPAGALSSGVDHDEEHFPPPKPTVSLRFLRHEALVVAGGIIAVVLLAALVLPIAAGSFSGAALLMTIFFLAAFIGLFTIPVWAAAMVDDLEDHAGEFDEDEVRDSAQR